MSSSLVLIIKYISLSLALFSCLNAKSIEVSRNDEQRENKYNKIIAIENFIPFGPDAGDTTMFLNDDEFVGPIVISTTFPFFNKTYSSVFVNTNGILSFDRGVREYVPNPFPLQNIIGISPYWTDIDTRNGGNIYYREITQTNLLNKIASDIRLSFAELQNFRPNWAYVVTWHDVAEYGKTDGKGCTFQVIIVTNGVNSFAIYYYNKLEWPVSVNNHRVQAGFNSGDGINFKILEGSFTDDILFLKDRSNVNIPGKYIYQIDGAEIQDTNCNDKGYLTISPSLVYFTGEDITVYGPCFNQTDRVVIKVDNRLVVECEYVDSFQTLCRLPFLDRLGKLSIELKINEQNTFFGNIYSRNGFIAKNINGIDSVYNVDELTKNISLSWNLQSYLAHGQLELFYVTVSKSNDAISSLLTVANDRLTTNTAVFDLSNLKTNDRSYSGELFYFGIREKSLIEVMNNRQSKTIQRYNTLRVEQLRVTNTAEATDRCIRWSRSESNNNIQIDKSLLNGCPIKAPYRNQWFDSFWTYTKDPKCNPNNPNGCGLFSPAACCYVHDRVVGSTASRRCCYSSTQDLILEKSPFLLYHPNDIVNHEFFDFVPYLDCCISSNNCRIFSNKRPTEPGVNWRDHWAFGDPHFTSLDGQSFTFNGHGEYVLLEIKEIELVIQVRLTPFVNENGKQSEGTVIKALAVSARNTDKFQFELTQNNDIDVLIDGALFQMTDSPLSISFNGLDFYYSQNFYAVKLESGTSLEISVSEDQNALAFSLTVPDRFNGKTRGLVGVKDDNIANDFTLPDGTSYLIDANNDREIFERFGQHWIVEESNSIFTYFPGYPYSSFRNDSFVPKFLQDGIHFENAEIENRAKEICGTDNQCLFDVSLTNDLKMGEFSKNIIEEIEYKETYHEESAKTCLALSNVLVNGIVNSTHLTENHFEYTFECDEGFCLKGPSKVICKEGKYDHELPTCGTCKQPLRLAFSMEYAKLMFFN